MHLNFILTFAGFRHGAVVHRGGFRLRTTTLFDMFVFLEATFAQVRALPQQTILVD